MRGPDDRLLGRAQVRVRLLLGAGETGRDPSVPYPLDVCPSRVSSAGRVHGAGTQPLPVRVSIRMEQGTRARGSCAPGGLDRAEGASRGRSHANSLGRGGAQPGRGHRVLRSMEAEAPGRAAGGRGGGSTHRPPRFTALRRLCVFTNRRSVQPLDRRAHRRLFSNSLCSLRVSVSHLVILRIFQPFSLVFCLW